MTIANVALGERGIELTWDDDSKSELPFIWLRDNDPGELHPDTRERLFDLTTVALDITPTAFGVADDALVIEWPYKQTQSIYPLDWLRVHRPGKSRPDPAVVPPSLWDHETLKEIPRWDAPVCALDAEMLRDALLDLKGIGLVIFAGLDDDPAAGDLFGDLIGFKRQTNFGTMYDVLSRKNPNNLAYTSLALPLHTDLPNQEAVPGYQFLHSYRNSTKGGDSVFADGFRICADLRDSAPDEFEMLLTVKLPWRFHDESCDIRQYRPIISQRDDGEFDRFVFNAHIADIPDFPANKQIDFYRAYRNLMLRVRDPRYSIQHSLKPGEMVVFDNARILHSRTAFDPGSGDRHFRGYYIERNEVDSRIRMLVHRIGAE